MKRLIFFEGVYDTLDLFIYVKKNYSAYTVLDVCEWHIVYKDRV